MHNRLALWFFAFMIPLFGSSQLTFSPYSRYGLGEYFGGMSTRNYSMGGIGIGSFDHMTINRANPASYADLSLTTLDFSTYANFSLQQSDLNSTDEFTGGFQNVAIGFSNHKNWGVVMGFAPYSTIGYNVQTRDSFLLDSTYMAYSQRYYGDGGLNQLYLGFGVRFLKSFRAGANFNYSFGNLNHRWSLDFDDGNYRPSFFIDHGDVAGFQPQLGIQYADTLSLRHKADRVTDLNHEIASVDASLKTLAKEEAQLQKERAGIDKKEAGRQAKIQRLLAEKKALEAEVASLMANEAANEKQIAKNQNKGFRLDKKAKKIERKTKLERKAVSDAQGRLNNRKAKLEEKKKGFQIQIKAVEEGRTSSQVTKQDHYLIRVGVVAEPASQLSGNHSFTFHTFTADTITSAEGSLTIPMSYGLGFSIGKPNKFSLGADLSFQNWSKFSYFGQNQALGNELRANVGLEWKPNIYGNSYLQRIAYRFGAYYRSNFLTVDGESIPEMGVTFGAGLPIGFLNRVTLDYSRLNLGFGIGIRGTRAASLLQETVFTCRLGVNLNDVWFIRPKID